MRSGVLAALSAVIAMLAPVLLQPGPAQAFETYAAVKRALYDHVFVERPRTLYCNCAFDRMRRPDLGSCGYRSPGANDRANRVEVDHVVPASWIGEGRLCWQRKICRDTKGRSFKGRKCCLQSDPAFRAAYQDLHNLRPTVGEVNEQRSNYRFALVEGEIRQFGRCDLEIDRTQRLVEPRPDIRGNIARISLYMAENHGIRLSVDQRHLFETWHQSDPPDRDEQRRNRIIAKLQGRLNRFVGNTHSGM